MLEKVGQASGSAIKHVAKGLFNSGGRRPRIVAHTGGIPPISQMGSMGGRGGIKQSMDLERLKSPHLRSRDISGRRTRRF